jgi:murein DD-endopeptidase MepM/ murein hydrolase activator NlpD
VALAAVCLSLVLAGCSSSVSRINMPSLGLGSETSENADLATTSALPVPQESVYSQGAYSQPSYSQGSYSQGSYGQGSANASLQRTALPPPSYSPAPRYDAAPPRQAQTYTEPPRQAEAYAPPRPRGATIKVAKGDTLSSLSRRYGVPVEQIISANELPDGRLAPGQELIMPGVTPAKAAAIAKAQTQTNVRVVKTETIAAPKPASLAEEEAAEADGAEPGAKQAAKANDTEANQPGAKSEGMAAAPQTAGAETKRVTSVDQLPAPDPMSGNSFRWPVKGRVISGFGTRPDGGHNDGIDVAVPQGTSVKAAENGVVAYSGNELKGYGNLVLIRHANNWVSAYANNEELLVKRGDKVRRGQIIAKAGATGGVSQPQVHFELRKGSRPVDPTKHMSDQAASAE